MDGIKVSVVYGDAFQIKAETLVLKYAQSAFGLDREIIKRFAVAGHSIESKLPKVWKYFFTESEKITNTKNIIFIGTPPLGDFAYKEIREFGRQALISLASSGSDTKSISMTVHGPGFGLDEIEAFSSQVAGIVESISAKDYPEHLEEIIFIEHSESRSERLSEVLKNLFQDGIIPTPKSSGTLKYMAVSSAETLNSAGTNSENKKNIFVAMPFSVDFEDIFYYGISGPVNSAGFLCERADMESFTGDVMEWVKSRISSSSLIIADLTTANPNVYLEVGFAWGRDKRTVLLIKDPNELKFDTKGQRCLAYTSIKDLETKLKSELEKLNLS